jgi:hypothetical protein
VKKRKILEAWLKRQSACVASTRPSKIPEPQKKKKKKERRKHKNKILVHFLIKLLHEATGNQKSVHENSFFTWIFLTLEHTLSSRTRAEPSHTAVKKLF